MKTLYLFILILISTLSFGQEEMTHEGVFDGNNIVLLNRNIRKDKYCIKEYSINGIKIKAPKENTFEIDLKNHLKPNEKYILIIYHRDYCKPRILSDDMAY